MFGILVGAPLGPVCLLITGFPEGSPRLSHLPPLGAPGAAASVERASSALELGSGTEDNRSHLPTAAVPQTAPPGPRQCHSLGDGVMSQPLRFLGSRSHFVNEATEAKTLGPSLLP